MITDVQVETALDVWYDDGGDWKTKRHWEAKVTHDYYLKKRREDMRRALEAATPTTGTDIEPEAVTLLRWLLDAVQYERQYQHSNTGKAHTDWIVGNIVIFLTRLDGATR